MPKIEKLPRHVADLIAAGEVVERPSSAAKELIENAIDAGATAVTVEAQNGGVALLRVADDGCGMSPEDAGNAFLRHATSKIRTAEDLFCVKTLGFRGEALAAISAVSRVDLLTREQGAEFGVSVRVEGGDIGEVSRAGCPAGTTIVIRDMFYNTPARQKFLKKDNYEAAQIQSVVIRAAQSHPEVTFIFLRDGREELRTPGNGDLLACLHSLWGREAAAQLVKVKSEHMSCSLTGYVGVPALTRGSRETQFFFVNGRPVRSRTMSAAMEEVFRHSIPSGRFPVCSLHLSMPEELYDVNVHPAKLEVKFANERAVFETVYAGMRDALSENPAHREWKASHLRQPTVEQAKSLDIPTTSCGTDERTDKKVIEKADTTIGQSNAPIVTATPENRAAHAVQASPKVSTPPRDAARDTPDIREVSADGYASGRRNVLTVESPPDIAQISFAAHTQGEQAQTEIDGIDDFHFAGEVFGGFLLVEQGDKLIIIDKHAAHERKLFDELSARSGSPMSQALIAPVVAALTPNEFEVILENEKTLEEIGFELSPFGSNSIAVRAVPDGAEISDIAALLSEMSSVLQKGRRSPWEERRTALLEMIACKAAVKVGGRSSRGEALEVARWVIKDKELWHCPHGRPVAVVMSRADIDRQFLR